MTDEEEHFDDDVRYRKNSSVTSGTLLAVLRLIANNASASARDIITVSDIEHAIREFEK